MPSRALEISRLAERDLEQLLDYIAGRAGARTALEYVDRLEAAVGRLVNFPDRGRPRPDIGQDIRTYAFERQVLVIYHAGERRVRILRVLAGGRRIPGEIDDEF